MSNLTYVGPEHKGPHYLESGKRPAGNPSDSYSGIRVCCIAQFMDGDDVMIRPAVFLPITGNFMVHEQLVTPICWWQMPDAAPMTERGWWMAQEWKQEFWYEWGVERYLYRFQGYFWEDTLQLAAFSFITHCDTIEEAKATAYNHWVEAGRP